MVQVSIGGMPGSGKSTVAKLVAKKLNLKFYSTGNIMRELAAKRGLSIEEYISLKEDVDSEIDNYQKNLGEKEDDFIIEGRLAFKFIPNSIKIFFGTGLKTAAARIFANQRTKSEKSYKSDADAFASIKSRMELDTKRYKKLYGVDAYNPENFDYIIDTTEMALGEVVDNVVKIIKHAKGL